MQIVLHPKVYSDVAKIMEYYEQTASPDLADKFYRELRYFIEEAGRRSKAFPVREGDIRRVNLQRFPYHFLFRLVEDSVRILVVRHHRRHPSLGLRRQ